MWNYMWVCDGYLIISLDQCIRLSSRLLWYQILSVCFLGLQRGHQENPYEKDWDRSRSVHLMEIWQISCLEDVRQAQMDLSGPRGPRWRAMWYYTWLEELVSESNTIQTQEDISVSGKIAGNTKPKLCIYLVWFIGNISGFLNSFWLASCVVQDIISLLDRILTDFMLRGR